MAKVTCSSSRAVRGCVHKPRAADRCHRLECSTRGTKSKDSPGRSWVNVARTEFQRPSVGIPGTRSRGDCDTRCLYPRGSSEILQNSFPRVGVAGVRAALEEKLLYHSEHPSQALRGETLVLLPPFCLFLASPEFLP